MEFDRTGFEREVAKRLQLHRKNRGITQEGLASRIGMTRPSYANIEAGRQRIPLDVVWRAAIVLGVSLSALVPEPLTRSSVAIAPLQLTSSVMNELPATVISSATMSPLIAFATSQDVPKNVRVIRKPTDTSTS